MGNRWGNSRNSVRLYFWGAPKSLQMVTAAMKLKDAYSLEEVMTNLDSILKSRDITLPTKIRLVNMPANLKNSAVATGLEKVSFHSNPKDMQCQRILKLLHNCTHLTC